MVEDDNQFLEVKIKNLKIKINLQKQKNPGHCSWNRTRMEGDEAVDEKCRQDAEQLSGSQS